MPYKSVCVDRSRGRESNLGRPEYEQLHGKIDCVIKAWEHFVRNSQHCDNGGSHEVHVLFILQSASLTTAEDPEQNARSHEVHKDERTLRAS
jgi:hypothetical protein